MRQRITVAGIEFDGTLDVLPGLIAIPAIEVGVSQGQMCLMIGLVEFKGSLRGLERLLVGGAQLGRQRKVQGFHLVSQSQSRMSA